MTNFAIISWPHFGLTFSSQSAQLNANFLQKQSQSKTDFFPPLLKSLIHCPLIASFSCWADPTQDSHALHRLQPTLHFNRSTAHLMSFDKSAKVRTYLILFKFSYSFNNIYIYIDIKSRTLWISQKISVK